MNPNIKLVIGLVGQKNSGKDTVHQIIADYVMVHFSLHVYRLAFADELKHEVAALFGATDIKIMEANKNNPIVRQAFQNHGTNRREEFGKSYWIDKIRTRLVSEGHDHPCIIVITDVRHKNEAEFIKKECCGTLIRIYRTQTDNAGDTHESETELLHISCDYAINNDYTLRRLSFMVADVIKQMRIKKLL